MFLRWLAGEVDALGGGHSAAFPYQEAVFYGNIFVEPPVARFSVWASGLECTIDDSKAREQLGYVPVVTREHGLTELIVDTPEDYDNWLQGQSAGDDRVWVEMLMAGSSNMTLLMTCVAMS